MTSSCWISPRRSTACPIKEAVSNPGSDSSPMTAFCTNASKTKCLLVTSQNDNHSPGTGLNNLTEWEKKWGMAFHPEKCSTIRVTRSRKSISSTYTYTLKGRRLHTVRWSEASVQHVLESPHGPGCQENKHHSRISSP